MNRARNRCTRSSTLP